MSSGNGPRVLVRKRDDRMIAGVCSGLAGYLGIDVTVTRVLFAVLTIFSGGLGVLAYLALWALVPEEGSRRSIAEDMLSKGRNG